MVGEFTAPAEVYARGVAAHRPTMSEQERTRIGEGRWKGAGLAWQVEVAAACPARARSLARRANASSVPCGRLLLWYRTDSRMERGWFMQCLLAHGVGGHCCMKEGVAAAVWQVDKWSGSGMQGVKGTAR